MKLFNGVTLGMNDFRVLLMAVWGTIVASILSALVLYLLFGVLGGTAGIIVGSVFAAGVAASIAYIAYLCYGIVSRIRSGVTS